MSFKIAKRYREAAAAINVVPVDKFPRLLGRVFQKLHIKGERLFSAAEEDQLKTLFGLSSEELELIMDGCCYTFEQAAFTLTGPEALYNILLEAGFDDPHAKVMGRLWATEASEFVTKLKARNLGATTLQDTNFHLNLSMGQSTLSKLQEPRAMFELTLATEGATASTETGRKDGEGVVSKDSNVEKLCIEFSHEELYSFFNQLEQVQEQIDQLSGGADA